MNDNKILSHTTWNCKYHIVFAPKYRRKIFYESHRKAIMETIRELCRWKGVEIVEGEMAEVPEREEQFDNISKVRTSEISIQVPRILVSWLLCRHDGQEHRGDKEVYTKSVEAR